jgi:hypothetical protein
MQVQWGDVRRASGAFGTPSFPASRTSRQGGATISTPTTRGAQPLAEEEIASETPWVSSSSPKFLTRNSCTSRSGDHPTDPAAPSIGMSALRNLTVRSVAYIKHYSFSRSRLSRSPLSFYCAPVPSAIAITKITIAKAIAYHRYHGRRS